VGSQSAAAGGGLRYAMVTSTQGTGTELQQQRRHRQCRPVREVRFRAHHGQLRLPLQRRRQWRKLHDPGRRSPAPITCCCRQRPRIPASSLTGSASGNRKPAAAFTVGGTGLGANFTDHLQRRRRRRHQPQLAVRDGSSSTLANPAHTYGLAGAYTVQLTAKDASLASNCVIKQVNVNPAPAALANGVPVSNLAANIGGQLRYTLAVPAGASNLSFNTSGGTGDADLYVKLGSPPTLSSYDCVSGSPTTVESCVLPSATAGTWYVMVNAYSKISGVSLTGSYGGGGGGNTAPVANFSFTTSGLTANFTDASTDSGGSIASRQWNFGDGSSSTAASPAHTYASAGTYTVQLTVTDNGGLSNSISKQVTVSSGGGAGVSVSIADVAARRGQQPQPA
jgi:PKD repeat protein